VQEVEIHGAGVAGLLAALALADRFPVTLIAPRPCRANHAQEIVDAEFVESLTGLGLAHVWQALPGRTVISGVRSAWHGQDGTPWADAFRPKNGRYAINRGVLEQALSSLIDHRPTIRRALVARRAGFIVDATGRASALGRRLGARSRILATLVGHIGRGTGCGLSSPIVEPVDTGWWFLSGDADNAIATYFSQGKLSVGDDEWNDALAKAPLIRRHFVRDDRVPLTSVPASSSCLEPSCGANWAAVGDAALARDPLSSGGLAGAARSALLLRSCMTETDFNSDEYERHMCLESARYRIGRQRYYQTMADQLGGGFWVGQAQLTQSMPEGVRLS